MKRTALALVAVATATSAGAAPTPPDPARLTRAHRELAVDLFKRIATPGQNELISPSSIAAALEMTRAGAAGRTLADMSKVLHTDELPTAELAPAEAALRGELQALDGKDTQITIANRLWGAKGIGWRAPFLDSIAKAFGGGLQPLDFGDTEASRRTINDWVAHTTHDRILDLIPAGALDPTTRLVLTNAIYFKGSWTGAFDPKATTREAFHTASGDVTAALMHRHGSIAVATDHGATIAELPYQGGALAMDLIIPDGAVEDLEKTLTADQLDRWFGELSDTEDVDLTMPRFESTSTYGLVAPLEQLGMATAFGDGADFSGMETDDPVKIGSVIHKTFVHVDEVGSEAAAATAVGMIQITAERPHVDVRADHPFLYVIRDVANGEILFLGRVADPTKS